MEIELSDHKYLDLLMKFYQQNIKNHPNKNKLAILFQKFSDFYNKQAKWREMESVRYSPTLEKSVPQKEFEFKSLRQTDNVSRQILNVNQSIRASKKSDSSREKSETECKFFNYECIYASQNINKLILYSIISTYILSDNVFLFKLLEDRINQYLSENNILQGMKMVVITRQWQRIGDLLSKKNTKWHKMLKEIVDRLDDCFTQLACRLALNMNTKITRLDEEVSKKFAKQAKISLNIFEIYFKEIESLHSYGNAHLQISIGYLRHKNMYIFTNRVPEYSATEIKNRQIRQKMLEGVNQLIQRYKQNNNSIDIQSFGDVNQKEKKIDEYFKRQLSKLSNNL